MKFSTMVYFAIKYLSSVFLQNAGHQCTTKAVLSTAVNSQEGSEMAIVYGTFTRRTKASYYGLNI